MKVFAIDRQSKISFRDNQSPKSFIATGTGRVPLDPGL